MNQRPMTPKERKRRQRERERRFGMTTYPLRLAAVQRVDLDKAFRAAGFYDATEYLISLLNRDLSRMGIERTKPEDLEGNR